MKHIICKNYTHTECDYDLVGADIEKMKHLFRTHLESIHIGKSGQKQTLGKPQIREIMQALDNTLMGLNLASPDYSNKMTAQKRN